MEHALLCASIIRWRCYIFKPNRGINSKWAIFELCHCCIQWAILFCVLVADMCSSCSNCRDVEMSCNTVWQNVCSILHCNSCVYLCVCDLLHILLTLWQLWIHVMCVCVCVCMYVCMYVCNMYVGTYIYTYTDTYVHTYVCICVIRMYVCMYVPTYVDMYVY